MGALVVYESMFGNTRAVASAVAEGITTVLPADVVEVGQAPPLAYLRTDLLVVGAPTHAFGLSRPQTRADAARRAGRPVLSDGQGLREWLDAADDARLTAAAFDTHARRPNLPGWASRAALKRLRRLGCTTVGRAASFYVDGYEGPVLDGELDRARAWGAAVAETASRGVGMSR